MALRHEGRASFMQLLQWRSAIKLEKQGIRVARRSVRRHAALVMGCPERVGHDALIEHLDNVIDECKAKGAGLTTIVQFGEEESD